MNGIEDIRPNPDDLLESIRKEESQKKKGKLKIFLGMAAGVGKTYAMLEAAQKLRKEGVDVVVGAVDSHGRRETENLLEGLSVIPMKKVSYRNYVFDELDIDAILERKPSLVLVDELAHSNVPGSRHPKRWQDVMELLDHGIDVYTTLNVQHIESLKDMIEKITGITIRETVPDLIIDQASSIELIDLSPDELLQRLREGKVYLGDQSILAAQNFFQEDRLTALREIVLRYTAEKVEHDLQGMVSSIERPEGWKLRERLLVALSHSPHSQKLLRITRRLAFNLDAPWIALHVDDGRILDKEDEEMLAKNLALARDLGAEVITTTGSDISQAIQRVARQKSVTQIIIGRPPSPWIFNVFQPNTLMDHLAKECSDIDLHVIRQTLFSKKYGKRLSWPKMSLQISPYLIVLGTVFALSLFSWYSLAFIGYKVVGFLFLLGILILSLFFRKGPVFFGSILYAVIWGVFFIPTQTPTAETSNEDLILLAFYLLTAIFMGILTDRARKNKELLAKREKSIEVLYDIVRKIAAAGTVDEAITSVKDGLSSALDGRCEIILPDKGGDLHFDETIPLFKNDKERAAAQWVYQNGKEAGWSTTTLPFAQCFYIPLKGSKEVVGVLAFIPKDAKELKIEEINFLHTAAHQLANFIERMKGEERAREYEQHKQVEKIYQSILNLISNLFEGPLLTIKESAKKLKELELPEISDELIHPVDKITVSTDSLTRILDNISAMVNLSAGITPVHKVKHDFKALVRAFHSRLSHTLIGFKWQLELEDAIPEFPFDHDLIELLLYNLAFHAMEFALPESTIMIKGSRSGDFVHLSVSAEGQSIPQEILDVAFERFYRVPGTTTDGLGLGLSIAKAIAEVHDGGLEVKNHPRGGMVFTLYLPLQ